MNKIEKVINKEIDPTTLRFGLSTLHAWIRFFEYFLHVSYRLDIKKWQVRGEDKGKFLSRKKMIQEKFKTIMGLKVDYVRSGGEGTSNDGNTSRRFFDDPSIAAEITGIKESLIIRCATILKAMSSGYEINKKIFSEYAIETAKLLVKEYPWYYMPASVHKILLHGSSVISAALLPIGQMSEEAQEARNKDLKNIRENYTRKCSRIKTNVDLLHGLLVSSDPLISSLRKLPSKKMSSFSTEVLQLLTAIEPTYDLAENSSSDEN
ncbi:uncharacterized protein LOC112689694 [Sipha flava]|uniref:Uncharacterized protein LOC112689694 n=1 Tax=Sipha flava TaxID=143950 RepID=A0A8B8G9M7_9HEMI|nr:uncharacterized protein LOC112689694 [Sipha flava]